MTNKSGVSEQIISLPKGGGSMKGLGEKFQPDLYTGTGNFTIPIEIPAGRNGFQPQLVLSYSTGNGNGPFGLGWNVGIPNISRKTSKGIPKYYDKIEYIDSKFVENDDEEDIFVLSGADDLVPLGNGYYRPRIEGMFSKIQKIKSADGQPSWVISSKDGTKSFYGDSHESRLFDKSDKDQTKIFSWLLSETVDTFGNKIKYSYKHDDGQNIPRSEILLEEKNHSYNQVYLESIEYVDYKDNTTGIENYLFKIEFDYGEFDKVNGTKVRDWDIRTDRFSTYKAGFEIRTARICKRIWIKRVSDSGNEDYVPIKSYDFQYKIDKYTKISLLHSLIVCGYKENESQSLPPLSFGYTDFEPYQRKFSNFSSSKQGFLPEKSLADPDFEIIDLFGNALPSLVNSTQSGWRYWKNNGNLELDYPKNLKWSPSGVRLSQAGVQFADMNGDGSVDLLVTEGVQNGYYSKDDFTGEWKKFYPYLDAPSFDLKDPNVKLMDMNGDGVIDVFASFDNYFYLILNKGNNSSLRFDKPLKIDRLHNLDLFPNVFFDSPDKRVFLADMTGDGMQDIVLLHSGRIDYWPNLGYGKFGKRITTRSSPKFKRDYDPAKIFFSDINGDGLADMVYVDFDRVNVWINQSGNSWSEEYEIFGTPKIASTDSVRIVDMNGTGTAGVLWSYNLSSQNRDKNYKFLDFTGGIKPLLLNKIINNTGAETIIEYRPSTYYYLKDLKDGKPWKTSLPFPVQVVSRVESFDVFSKGKMVTEYFYHHGYWDKKEREFRGFGRVDNRDTQYFKDYNGSSPTAKEFEQVPLMFYSPPVETSTWFHQGSVQETGIGKVMEIDYADEFWHGDKQVLTRPSTMINFLDGLTEDAKHSALRSMKGSSLRTEVYSLDGTDRQNLPYTVTEKLFGTSMLYNDSNLPDSNMEDRPMNVVFFPHLLGERSTKWERGDDPMTSFQFTGKYDNYGQPRLNLSIAVPRGQDFNMPTLAGNDLYLIKMSETTYAIRDDAISFIVDRTIRLASYEIKDNNTLNVFGYRDSILNGSINYDLKTVIGQSINYYDGDPFVGLPFGQIDKGALVRTENLVLTDKILQEAYGDHIPQYLLNEQWAPFPSSDGLYPKKFIENLKPRAGYRYCNFKKDSRDCSYLFSATFGSYGSEENQFKSPRGIALDPKTGEVYVADTGNGRIQKFDKNGNFIKIVTRDLDTPVSISIDPNNGDMYIAEAVESKIKRYSSQGQLITSWGGYGSGDTQFKNIWGQICTDQSSNIYVPDWDNHRVQKFDKNGTLLKSFNGGTSNKIQYNLKSPSGVDCDSSGNVYVVDSSGLWKFSAQGHLLQFTNRLSPNLPSSVTIDSSGHIYETYRSQNKVQKFDPSGTILLNTWGESGKGEGQFGDYQKEEGLGPYALDINSDIGRIYVTDTANNRIQVFSVHYESGYYALSTRNRYDFHENSGRSGKGLIISTLDPLDNQTEILFDKFEIFPIQIKDPAGLTTKATYNYQALQPELVIDNNENRTSYVFNPLGMVSNVYIAGKIGDHEGDNSRPSRQYFYNFDNYIETNGLAPIYIHNTNYEYHDTSINISETDMIRNIQSVEYFDGSGRSIQSKSQCDEIIFDDEKYGHINLSIDPLQNIGDTVGYRNSDVLHPRVTVSGFERRNNKGEIVEKYEPFFSKGWEYEPLQSDMSQKITFYFDGLGRSIRTVNADNSEQYVIYGVPKDLTTPKEYYPSPWEIYNYDSNDNARRSHPADSGVMTFSHHFDTPSNTIMDALGRKVKQIQRNGRDQLTEWYETSFTYDIGGNLLSVTDALKRIVSKQSYDLIGSPIGLELLDAGKKFTFYDASGNLIEQYSNLRSILHSYDQLNRPLYIWVKENEDSTFSLREILIYGDDLSRSGLTLEKSLRSNLMGKLFKHYDEAGLITYIDPSNSDSRSYDFKGNILEKTRQVISDKSLLLDIERRSNSNNLRAIFTVDWTPLTVDGFIKEEYKEVLDLSEYTTSIRYDALNRVKTEILPRDIEGNRKVLQFHHNLNGSLQTIKLDGVNYLKNIGYNAKGQITLIIYGNDTMIRYLYDKKNFRLRRLRSETYANPTEFVYRPRGKIFQDIVYEYDLVGNILKIKDRSPNCGIPKTPLGINALDKSFVYSPIYQLMSATGREHNYTFLELSDPWSSDRHISDITNTREYEQKYQYDRAGNMQNLIHSANNNGYTKNFEYDFSGNKLKSVSLGKIGNEHSFSYKYDKAGNLSNEGPTRCFVWDHNNRLKSFYIQTGDSPPSLMTSYLYDSNGTRVKKLVKKQGILDYDVSVYLDTMFEYHTKVQHKEVKEDNMIHILNDNNRIAIIRIGQSIHETGHLPDIQYVLGDHLSNSSMMIDDASSIVSVEEYYPFGETSFGNFARKRYRYAGKERDEENGFYYFGARYLAPWLARWTSCDPLFNEGTNLYMYVKNNPLILVDLHGTQSNTIHTKDGSTSKVNGNILGNESGTGQTFSAVAQTASTAAATAYGLVEWSIWNPGINLTRAQQFAIDSRRGFIFDELAGNNLGKNFPQADYVTDTVVGQTKSTRSTAAQTVRKITIKAAQDAQKAIAKNPDFIGKTAEARIVLPTGSKKETVAAARNALGGKSIAGQVKVSTGIPGVGGTILKGLGFVGAGASAYGLYQDYQQNNVASGIGNAASLASSGLSVAGAAVGSTVLAASGAVTGAFAMGYGVGSIINSVLPENAQMAIGETIFNTLELVGFQPKNW